LRAVFSGWRGPEPPGWLARVRQFDLQRRLALVLTVLAVVSGLATYVVISRAAPYGAGVRTVLFLLNLNLVLLLLLGAVIARRVTQVLIEWRRGTRARACTPGWWRCSASWRWRRRSWWRCSRCSS
jgi:hypothetical protein